MSDLGALIGRALLAAIFILSGFGKLMAVAGIAKMLGDKGFPQPVLFGYAAGVVEFVGGLLILIGFRVRLVALAMIVFVASTILVSHNFWTMEGQAYMQNRTHAMKNLAIMGGFLLLAVFGPGRFSVGGGRG